MTQPRRQDPRTRQAPAASMAGAVDLAAVKARSEAQQKAAERAEQQKQSGEAPSSGAVLDVTEASFQADVVEASMHHLVLVDLWAEWCGPCKQLSPVLERLASAAGGAWTLAKVDVDANPRIAQLFGAQSIPTVVAIAAGQPVDAFSGALPEAEIRKWIDPLLDALRDKLPGIAEASASGDGGVEEPEDERFAEAEDALDRGDYAAAEAVYLRILDSEPANEQAKAALNQVRFAARAEGADPSAVAAADADPSNVDAGIKASDAEVAAGQVDEAFARLIALVRRSSGDDRDKARTHLVDLFELFDPADARVAKARRDLASALF